MNDRRLATEVKNRIDDAAISAYGRGYNAGLEDGRGESEPSSMGYILAFLMGVGAASLLAIAVSVYAGGLLPW